jgi:hypothetical protein
VQDLQAEAGAGRYRWALRLLLVRAATSRLAVARRPDKDLASRSWRRGVRRRGLEVLFQLESVAATADPVVLCVSARVARLLMSTSEVQ